jgi:hypothetical protein
MGCRLAPSSLTCEELAEAKSHALKDKNGMPCIWGPSTGRPHDRDGLSINHGLTNSLRTQGNSCGMASLAVDAAANLRFVPKLSIRMTSE